MAPTPSPKVGERPRDLLAEVAAGDGEALVRFYAQCVEGLYAFVFYRVGKDAALAEDVVQETFLAALDRPGDFDPERGSLRAWVCQLSRNVIRKRLVERRRTVELAMWEKLDETLTHALGRIEREVLVDEVLERQETQELVYVAMGHLPESYRRVLEQKYVAGRSLDELAGELGLSIDAVKSLLARARRAFRETFATLGAVEVTP